MFLVGLAFAGLGLVMTALAKSFDFFIFYFTLAITPMMFLAGVFFPRERLPRAVQLVGDLLPLSHGISLSRALTLGLPVAHPVVNVAVLAAYAAASVLIAIALLKRRLMK
jgi:lipooligosaccharide transport system permease protein